jgi:1-deoxy-D-xylulose-5-phosphate synthase
MDQEVTTRDRQGGIDQRRRRAVIIAIGSMVCPSIEAAKKLAEEGTSVAVVNARFVKPLDAGMFLAFAKRTGRVVTVEEHALQGGFGSAVLECFEEHKVSGIKTLRIGIPDQFIEHGTQKELRHKYGLDADGIYERVKEFIESSRLKAVAPVANLKMN